MGASESSVMTDCVRNGSSLSVVLTSPQRSLAGEPGAQRIVAAISMMASTRRRLSTQEASSGRRPEGGLCRWFMRVAPDWMCTGRR
jgi:hypothetical protein